MLTDISYYNTKKVIINKIKINPLHYELVRRKKIKVYFAIVVIILMYVYVLKEKENEVNHELKELTFLYSFNQ